MTKTFFITGTDTNVGKTVFTYHASRILLKKNYRVHIIKAIQTGTALSEEADFLIYKKLLKIKDDETDRIVPYIFEAPLAPYIASLKENKKIMLHKIYDLILREKKNCDFLFVEGAGGLCVPLDKNIFIYELASLLEIPCILISKDALGTLNHTLLSYFFLKDKNIKIHSCLLNQKDKKMNDDNFNFLKTYIKEKFFKFPFLDKHLNDSHLENLILQLFVN